MPRSEWRGLTRSPTPIPTKPMVSPLRSRMRAHSSTARGRARRRMPRTSRRRDPVARRGTRMPGTRAFRHREQVSRACRACRCRSRLRRRCTSAGVSPAWLSKKRLEPTLTLARTWVVLVGIGTRCSACGRLGIHPRCSAAAVGVKPRSSCERSRRACARRLRRGLPSVSSTRVSTCEFGGGTAHGARAHLPGHIAASRIGQHCCRPLCRPCRDVRPRSPSVGALHEPGSAHAHHFVARACSRRQTGLSPGVHFQYRLTRGRRHRRSRWRCGGSSRRVWCARLWCRRYARAHAQTCSRSRRMPYVRSRRGR